MNIGFVGLGSMGTAIATHLVSSGHRVIVWNRTPQKADDLVKHGAVAAASLREALAGEVVFSMLADDDADEDVLMNSGEFDHARPGIIHVNLSTISIDMVRRLRDYHKKRGQRYVAAPVLGRPDVAERGELTIVTAGPADAVSTVQELFQSFSRKTWVVSEEPEHANVVKLANNFMLAAAIESMSEAAALASRYGVSAAQLLAITNAGGFACPIYQGYGQLIADETYEPAGFPIRLSAKDIRLGLLAAENAYVPMPVASAVNDSLLQALALGDGNLDSAALARVAQMRAGRATYSAGEQVH